jgi:hypothetical protein
MNHKSLLILIILISPCFLFSQQKSTKIVSDSIKKNKAIEVSEIGFGGPALKISRFNNQTAFMSGGRGSCLINNKFTIGGGGYGIANSIKIENNPSESERVYKMGYGGLELGYILHKHYNITLGSSLLMATGAEFWVSKPKNKKESIFDNGFQFIYVLEPSIYGEIRLNSFLKIHSGVSYRKVFGKQNNYVSRKYTNDFSAYFGILFGI